MEVKIGKKKYKLEKVSIYIAELYIEWAHLGNEVAIKLSDIDEATIKNKIAREEAETIVDKLRADLVLHKALREINKTSYVDSKVAMEKRVEVLREIVILNGYDFDEDEWFKNIDEGWFDELIDELIGNKKKEKANVI